MRFRVEPFRQLLVLRNRNAFVLHRPFMTAQDAIESKVNEHPKPRLVPPLHAALSIRHRRSSWALVLGLRLRLSQKRRGLQSGGRRHRTHGAKNAPAADCLVYRHKK